jgi:glutathionylspermidine synthase
MCLELVAEAVGSDALMARCHSEERRDLGRRQLALGSPSLYGRFDFAFHGSGPGQAAGI